MDILAKGIDVSHHNGAIDFEKVKKDGYDFVIIRGGFGVNNVDKKFHENIRKAHAAGLHIGVYWFSYAYSLQSAILEGQSCYNLIKDYNEIIDLPIYFDWEELSFNYCENTKGITPTKKDVSMWASAFLNYLENKNYYVGLYTNVNCLNLYFDNVIRQRYTLWLADWTKNCTYKGNYDVRQFQGDYSVIESVNVNGIFGAVDKNYLYKDLYTTIKNGGYNGFPKKTIEENTHNFDVNGDGKISAIDLIHLKNELLK